MIKRGRGIVGTSLRRQHRNWMLRIFGVLFLSFGVLWAAACSSEEGSYGPYHVIGYNYTDRHIFSFVVNGFGGGSSDAHEPGGGGGIVCCMEIPRRTKDLHIKVVYELTKEQYEKNFPTTHSKRTYRYRRYRTSTMDTSNSIFCQSSV